MKKRQLRFILALCVLAALLWIGGELVIGLVLNWGMTASRIWAILIIVLTCGFSLWKCPRE